jgi:hypothetical protein
LAELISEAEKSLFNPQIPFNKKFEDIFSIQYRLNSVYRTFLNALGYQERVQFSPESIPLLPVRAFKYGKILPDGFSANMVFSSSGTSSMTRSKHFIVKPELYEKSISTEFYTHFPKNDTVILALLPKYEDNPQSSLLWMAKYLIDNEPSGLSGFIHTNSDIDKGWIEQIKSSRKRVVILGAAFGLIDFMYWTNPFQSVNLEVIETGGMKTHKREMSKGELRNRISAYFDVPLTSVHSEYGMCELHSQMYAIGSEWFTTPDWVKVSIRKADDPEKECEFGEEGKIGIIDLANLYSCPFILTNDRGVMNSKGEFRVLGRWDKENMRGCNFLIDAES